MLKWLLPLLTLLALMAGGGLVRAEECPSGNLLEHLPPVESRGVDHPELLSDGWLTPDGRAWDSPEAAQMRTIRPFVLWALPQAARIRAAAIQADHDDIYRILVSTDGQEWSELWRAEPSTEPGLRERRTRDLDVTAKYVRLEAMGGDHAYSATELRVYCEIPDPWPPPAALRAALRENRDLTLTMWLRCAKVAIGLTALFLFGFVMPRVGKRARQRMCWGLVLAGVLAWPQFGFFQGHGRLIHHWDIFHYYLGSKYFPELGYFDLYRCTAKAEREMGRGNELDHALLRNLEDSRIYPGTWARQEQGQCRATFRPERWEAFKRDVAGLRTFFDDPPFVRVLSDHGFNATPVHAAWIRLWSSLVPPTRAGLMFLAQIDTVAYIGVLAFVFWGFGVEGCALVSLVLGIGLPWGYDWVGGSFARLVWISWLAAGLALLRRGREFAGSSALTVSGLLRLFPMAFVGAMGLWTVIQWVRDRALLPSSRRVLAGFLVTVTLGLALGATAGGISKYRDFARMIDRHSHTPLTNQMGLPVFLESGPGRYSADLVDQHLTDPYEIWKDAHLIALRDRAPLRLFAIAAAVALIAFVAFRGAPVWDCAALGGPLLFAANSMTSYDYSWLIALVPIVLGSRRRTLWLLGYVVFTQALGVYGYDMEVQHVAFSGGLLVTLIALSLDYVRDLIRPEAPEAANGVA